MFDVVTILVRADQTAVLRSLAVPVCRLHGYDDVLPDAEELGVQYTLLTASDGVHGDAADGFAGTAVHSDLVIITHRTAAPAHLALAAPGGTGLRRFPWHPWCQKFDPRGRSVSPTVLQEAAAREHLRQQQQQQRAPTGGPAGSNTGALEQQQLQQQKLPAVLVPVALHADLAFLQDFAAAVVQHNSKVLQQQEQLQLERQRLLAVQGQGFRDSGWATDHRRQLQELLACKTCQPQPQQPISTVLLAPLLQQTVVWAAAAVQIQSSWRAHRGRLVHRVAERALLNRAVRVIQRGWRAFVLRQRLQMLSTVSAAWNSAQQLKYSSLLCVDVASRRLADAIAERAAQGHGMFPEHRLRFVIDDDMDVFLVDVDNSSSSSSSLPSSSSGASEKSNTVTGGSSCDGTSSRTFNSSIGGSTSSSSELPGGSRSSRSNNNTPGNSSSGSAVNTSSCGGGTGSNSSNAGTNTHNSSSGSGGDTYNSAASVAVDEGTVADVSSSHPELDDLDSQPATAPSPPAAAAAEVRRFGFPKWLGINIPVISAAAAARILEDQLWFEPFGRADAAKLLDTGCEVKEILTTDLMSDPNLCHPRDVAQLITFKNKQQAAARAALLAAFTYNVKIQSACRLLTVQDTQLGAAYKNATKEVQMGPLGKEASHVTEEAAGYAAGRSLGSTEGSLDSTVVPAAAAAAAAAAEMAAAAAVPQIELSGVTGDGPHVSITAKLTGRITDRTQKANKASSRAVTRAVTGLKASSAAAAAAAEVVVECDAADAAVQAAEAVAKLKRLAEGPTDPQQPIPIKSTETLAAAAAAAGSSAAGSSDTDTAAAGGIGDPGSLHFYIHMFSRLPHLQSLARSVEAAAAAAAADPSDLDQSGSSSPAPAAGEADQSGTGVFKPTQLAVCAAEYYRQLKQEQVEALRAQLATEAAAAAATAAADLQTKQQAVAAARAAMAAVVAAAAGLEAADARAGSPTKHTQVLRTMQCTTPGYQPSSVAAAAAASQQLKQRQQAAAAAVVAAVRQEIREGRDEMLREIAVMKTQLKMKAQMESQALHQQQVHQDQQQQAAAESRVSLLRTIRGAGAAAYHQQQQVAGKFVGRSNLFSKHLHRGEVAVVKAAQQRQADILTMQQRLGNLQSSEAAQQRVQQAVGTKQLKAQEGKQTLNTMLVAAKEVAETELAGRRAKVAAAVLQEQGLRDGVKQPHSLKVAAIGGADDGVQSVEVDLELS